MHHLLIDNSTHPTDVKTIVPKNSENREQSHVYMKYAEVHPVFAGTAKT